MIPRLAVGSLRPESATTKMMYLIPAHTKCLVKVKGYRRVIQYETKKPLRFKDWCAVIDSGWYFFRHAGNLIEVKQEDVVLNEAK